MDRRESLKALTIGAFSGSILLEACKEDPRKGIAPTAPQPFTFDRQPVEKELFDKLSAERFFTAEEMATIAVLADIIIPADEVSGNASEAKVPDFIEFIVKDMPENQLPMRGGIRWLDIQSLKRFEKAFKDISETQRLEIVDDIAYPKKAKPGMEQGVAFFNLMRDLTVTGFYTSQIGVKDLGYAGNKPNQWNGVPEEVLKQYNVAYDERELKESVSFT